MNLPVLDIPENPQAWPQWLEGQLVGTTLGALVEQLAAVLETTSPGPSVEELCGAQFSVVLERGLSALSAEQLRQFLKHPQRLLELQERILTDSGPYWQAKLDTPAAREATARHWQRIEPQLTTATRPTQPGPAPSRRQFALVVGTLAASLLIGIGLWSRFSGDQSGWNGRGVLTAQLPADQFLQHLAERTGDYVNHPPHSAAELERQLVSIRRGCDALLSAPLSQLAGDERAWLKDRCRAWAQTFDGQLDELRRERRPWQAIHTDTEATLKKLANALRNPPV